jgi:hypothetical protein
MHCGAEQCTSHLTSYAGLFTVNPTFNSNMFFWFFPAAVGQDWDYDNDYGCSEIMPFVSSVRG